MDLLKLFGQLLSLGLVVLNGLHGVSISDVVAHKVTQEAELVEDPAFILVLLRHGWLDKRWPVLAGLLQEVHKAHGLPLVAN